MKLLASKAGIPLDPGRSVRRRITQHQRREKRLHVAAERYAGVERRELLWWAARLRGLEQLEAFAAQCLQDSFRAGFGTVNEPTEFWWRALARTYDEQWRALTAWLLLAFGPEDDRQRFVLYPKGRPALLAGVLDSGGVVDDNCRWRELMP